MKIKTKLILIFIVVKLIPLFILVFLAIYGIKELHSFIERSNSETLEKSTKIIEQTANKAIEDSILALDEKSQIALEIKTKDIAQSVAQFLYQRDNDILFLSSLNELSQQTLETFYNTKIKEVIIPQEFRYDEKLSKWIKKDDGADESTNLKALIQDNSKYFQHHKPRNYKTKKLNIYKEISFVDLSGKEIYKVSSIDKKLKNIADKTNTYCKAEEYFSKIKSLNKGEIYVSNVIGEYVGTKLIGHFTKDKAEQKGIDFKPQQYGYAGYENPVGKRFDGIVRFATPRFLNGKKVGYITLALDHRHIMEFTDYIIPTEEAVSNYSDASRGNYAFMWDSKGRSISHPRDYFIVGYDKNTGKPVKPWLSNEIVSKIEKSKMDWEEYLKDYPWFDNQTLSKKPNLKQLKEEGNVGLDCRYLNFAPQCSDWMNITQDGGYGSFVIFWSNVWKLTTVAAIPYYTGQYGDSKRGFGFVTLGANLDEFHEAAMKTKENIDGTLVEMQVDMKGKFQMMYEKITSHVHDLIEELTISTILMTILVIFIAIWIANYLTDSINKLLEGIKKFKKKEFSHRIEIKSKDEIGVLADAFNDMAKEIEYNVTYLDQEVANKTKVLTEKNILLEKAKKIARLGTWELDLNKMESLWSDNIKLMLGIDKDKTLDTKFFQSLLLEQDHLEFEEKIKACIVDNKDFQYSFKVKHQLSGDTMWFECRGSFIKERGVILGTAQDITEMKRNEKQINNYVNLINHNIITSTTDLEGVIIHVSEAFCEISGYSRDELIGNTHRIVKHEDMPQAIFKNMWKTLEADKTWKGELKNRKKEGGFYWVAMTISPIYDDDNKKIGYTAIRQDITDKKCIEEISITDGLTGIYNRRHFNMVFPKVINAAKRKNELVSFLIMDVDHFKQYNDNYGHQMGDEVLIKVAESIKSSLKRASDHCFRLGGEEFGVIFKTDTKEQAIEMSETIRANIEKLHIEHLQNSASKYITASLGLVCINANEIEDSNMIYKQADDNLYSAKKSGRNQVVF